MGLTRLLLFVSAAGLVTSASFLCFVVFASVRFRRRVRNAAATTDVSPPVTLLKPLCGLEPNLEANLASFFQQQYPSFEIIFGARDANDPALDIVRAVQKRFPSVPVKVVTTGEPKRPNAKVCSMMKMYTAASYHYLIISDSDVKVKPDYVREVVRPLLQPDAGLVTCLYRGVPTGGFWSQLEALGMSVEMTSGVLVADLLEGMKFALGPTMATRRDVLDRIGGFGILADYCADDYVLGAAVYGAGKSVVLSDYVIDHVVINRSLRKSLQHQMRWMKSTRFSRAWGHAGSVLTFAMPFGILGLFAATLLRRPLLGVACVSAACLNRIIMALASGFVAVGDPRSLLFCWLYPLRDIMGFGFWCASFFGREIWWRGARYRLEQGGRMMPCGLGGSATVYGADSESLRCAVAVDHLS